MTMTGRDGDDEDKDEEEVDDYDDNALCESCENGVWSGQLWQINSPPIFNENGPNFQWWCENIQIFDKLIPFPNIMDKSSENSKKPVGGVVTR